MTKKDFKEQSSIHIYGHGANRVVALFFDWKAGENFRGFKYLIATQGITKKEMIDLCYKRIIEGQYVYNAGWEFVKVAEKDEDRFRVPIAWSF